MICGGIFNLDNAHVWILHEQSALENDVSIMNPAVCQ